MIQHTLIYNIVPILDLSGWPPYRMQRVVAATRWKNEWTQVFSLCFCLCIENAKTFVYPTSENDIFSHDSLPDTLPFSLGSPEHLLWVYIRIKLLACILTVSLVYCLFLSVSRMFSCCFSHGLLPRQQSVKHSSHMLLHVPVFWLEALIIWASRLLYKGT